jgi:integrase
MSVYKRDGSPYWQYEFEIAGVRYRGSTEKSNKAEARDVETEKRKEVKAGAEGPVKKEMTIEELGEAWYAAEGSKLADARNNRSRLNKLLGKLEDPDSHKRMPGLPLNRKVHQLTEMDLERMVEDRMDRGNAPGTINRELSLLQSIFTWGRKRCRLPLWREDIKEYKKDEGDGKLRYLKLEEELRFLDELDPNKKDAAGRWLDPQNRPKRLDQYDLAVTLLDTGARYSEIANLLKDVVDLKARTINLYRSKVDNEGLILMTDRLYAIMERRMDKTRADNPYVFPARGDAEGPRSYAVKGIKAAFERAELNKPHLVERYGKVTTHTLRDTFASRLVQAGVSLRDIQVLLGHSTITMTEKYAKTAASIASQHAVAALNLIHGPQPNADVIPMVAERTALAPVIDLYRRRAA